MSLADQVRVWLGRFLVAEPDQLDLLTCWVLHTHILDELTTTPRLVVESPAPESGKTIAMEHLKRLCAGAELWVPPISAALVSRAVGQGVVSVLLLDEWDTVDPKAEGTSAVLGISNSGYRKGATRPVLGVAGRDWEVTQLAVYCAMGFSGIDLRSLLPEPTVTRTLFVEMLPAGEEPVEETDWDVLEEPAARIREALRARAEEVADRVAGHPVALPPYVRNRNRERWRPIFIAASIYGGPEWVQRIAGVCERWLAMEARDKAEGLARTQVHLIVLGVAARIVEEHPEVTLGGVLPTEFLLSTLRREHPFSEWEHPLTAKRLGGLMRKVQLRATATADKRVRGYEVAEIRRIARRLGRASARSAEPAEPAEPAGDPGTSGTFGASGASVGTADEATEDVFRYLEEQLAGDDPGDEHAWDH